MTALMLPVLLGFVGLGVEVGSWFQNKRDLQTIADAAAIAGAYEAQNYAKTIASVRAAAIADATRNGYDASTDNVVRAVNPPATGSFTTDEGAAEVVVTRSVALLFSSVFRSTNVTISARAVARTGNSPSEACILALSESGTGVDVTGSGDIAFDGCQTASNSPDADSLVVSGSGSLIVDCYTTAGYASGAENYDEGTIETGFNLDAGCDTKEEARQITDPYGANGRDLEVPDSYTPGDCNATDFDGSGADPDRTGMAWHEPYVFCGGFNIASGQTVNLPPGLYIIDGDFATGGNTAVYGDDVTFIFVNGGGLTNINGNTEIQMRAPDDAWTDANRWESGDTNGRDWRGILFFQDPVTATEDCSSTPTPPSCVNTINGNAASVFEGAVYFPDQTVRMNGGNQSTSSCLQIISDRVEFSGNSAVLSDNSLCPNAGVDGIALPGPVVLVE